MNTQRVSEGAVLHTHNLDTRRGGWSMACRSRFTPCKDPIPFVQDAGWALGASMDWCGKSHPH